MLRFAFGEDGFNNTHTRALFAAPESRIEMEWERDGGRQWKIERERGAEWESEEESEGQSAGLKKSERERNGLRVYSRNSERLRNSQGERAKTAFYILCLALMMMTILSASMQCNPCHAFRHKGNVVAVVVRHHHVSSQSPLRASPNLFSEICHISIQWHQLVCDFLINRLFGSARLLIPS